MSREEVELAQRHRHTRFLSRLALVSAVAVLLIAAAMAKASGLRTLDLPLALTLWLAIGVATVTAGLFVARSELSDDSGLSRIVAVVIAGMVGVALVFLTLMVYISFGGAIH